MIETYVADGLGMGLSVSVPKKIPVPKRARAVFGRIFPRADRRTVAWKKDTLGGCFFGHGQIVRCEIG